MNKFIFMDKAALKEIAAMLKIDISNVDINTIGGFDSDGIIYNDILNIIDWSDKLKNKDKG